MTINLKHAGEPEQLQLPVLRDDGDAEGKSSRFVLKDAQLIAHLEDEDMLTEQMLQVPRRGVKLQLCEQQGPESVA